MRTITETKELYTFEELTEEAKEKARERYRDGGLGYGWWDFCPDDYALDAKHFYFDLYRRSIDIKPARSAEDTARHIVENHGESCDSYKVAFDFLARLSTLMALLDGDDEEAADTAEEELDALAEGFLQELGECVLASLIREAEWLDSNENVDENITANEYEFTKDGRIA